MLSSGVAFAIRLRIERFNGRKRITPDWHHCHVDDSVYSIANHPAAGFLSYTDLQTDQLPLTLLSVIALFDLFHFRSLSAATSQYMRGNEGNNVRQDYRGREPSSADARRVMQIPQQLILVDDEEEMRWL